MRLLLCTVTCLVLLVTSLPTQAQSVTAITPENARDLAVVRRILPDDFGVPDAEIMQFAFHPDKRQLVVAMQGAPQRNALIGLYDIEQGEAMALMEDTTRRTIGYRAEDLQFNADGTLLVSTADHNGFIVWDLVQHEYLFGGTPTGMPVITPDNHYLIILTGTVAHIWDIPQRREVDRRQFGCAARIVMDGQAIECPQPADSPLLVDVYELPSFDLIESHKVQVPPPASYNMVSAVTPDGQLLTRIRPVTHEGHTMFVYEIMNPETFSIIESVSVDATWQSGSYAPSNSGLVVAYLDVQRRVILENPMTGVELLSLSQPGHSYQGYKYRFDLEDHYFGVLGTSSNMLELYAVADCYVTTDREINLRSGPGTEFDSPTIMQPGERLAVDGQSQQGNYIWWHLAVGLWVREDVVETHNNCRCYPGCPY